MPARAATQLVIDARPRGPRGPLAGEHVLGRSVLSHTVDLALSLGEPPIAIHARLEEHRRLEELVGHGGAGRVVFMTGPPPEDSAVLRTDRFYDRSRLRRALRSHRDPESAVLWRLDGPEGLTGAEAELVRRRSYQPIGKYWALAPARALARLLRPTRVRPNALTVASAALMIGTSLATAFGPSRTWVCLTIAGALAMALVLDTADGHLARLQGTSSDFGRWLDAYLDELSDMALHAGIAWSAYVRDGHPGWLLLGMLYGMGKYVFAAGNAIGGDASPRHIPAPNIEPLSGVSALPIEFKSATRLAELVRWIGHADIRWHFWIVLAAFGRLDWALAAYALYFPARSLAGAVRRGVRLA